MNIRSLPLGIKVTRLSLVIAVVMLTLLRNAWATDLSPAPTVSVSGTVQSQCGSAVNGAMSIDINPSLTGAQAMSITTNATVKCTNNRAVTVSAASAGSGLSSSTGSLSGTLTNGSDSINYTLVFNSNITGQGFGSGKDVGILVSGSVAETDAQAAVYTGTAYSDTVTLTITY